MRNPKIVLYEYDDAEDALLSHIFFYADNMLSYPPNNAIIVLFCSAHPIIQRVSKGGEDDDDDATSGGGVGELMYSCVFDCEKRAKIECFTIIIAPSGSYISICHAK